MVCLRSSLIAVVLLAAGLTTGHADSYPTRPIKMVVPFPAGGGGDAVARVIAPKLAEVLGKPVIIENVAGAAGNIGANMVALAEPDGHTLLFTNNSITINAGLPNKPRFDVLKDFEPVAMPVVTAVALAVNSNLRINTVEEFIAYAKTNPKAVTYSSCGVGTSMHLAGELMQQLAHFQMLHVPYRGCGPAVVDALSGVVPITFNSISNVAPQQQASGQQQSSLKVLAIGSAERSHLLPEVPTMNEAGVTGFEIEVWIGLLAPAKTPKEIINRLNAEITRIVKLPEVTKIYEQQFYDVRTPSPEEFGKQMRDEFTRFSRLIKDAGIQN